MHFATFLSVAALAASTLASPIGEPAAAACKTTTKLVTKTVTKSKTSTSTVPCPILSLPNVPIVTDLGVTGTLVPVGSILTGLTGGLLGRDAEPTAALAERIEERNAASTCWVTQQKTVKTITTTESGTVTTTPTNCPILSLPNVPIVTDLGVTGTLIPVGSILSGITGRDAQPEPTAA